MSQPSGPRDNDSSDTAEGAARVVAAELGAQIAPNLAEATDRLFNDASLMREVLAQYANCPVDKLQGRAFEFLETLKFNEAAARAGSALHASTTQMQTPTGPVDIEILDGAGRVLREIQAKSYGDASSAIRTLAQHKYHGQGRLVPSDQLDEIKARLEQRSSEHLARSQQEDVREHLMGRLEHGGVESPGTSREQAEFTARHPEWASRVLEGQAVLGEVAVAGAVGASVGAGFASLYGGISRGVAVYRGEMEPAEALVETGKIAVAGAVRGGTVASGARAIAIFGRQAGWVNFASSTGPAAMANTTFEVSRTLWRYKNGEIETDEMWEGVGGSLLRGSSAYYCGIAGQMLIPVPVVGALVGMAVGYTTSAVLIQSGLLGIGPSNEVRAEEERRKEIEKLCRASVQRMAECRLEIEELVATDAQVFAETLLPAMDRLELQLLTGDSASVMESLAAINEVFGATIPFRSFEEFDDFMTDPDTFLTV